mgnify:CR=1 FL=1
MFFSKTFPLHRTLSEIKKIVGAIDVVDFAVEKLKEIYGKDYYDEVISKLTKKEIRKYLLEICKGIIFLEKTRIAEVGWEISYTHNLTHKSKKDLTILYLKILKDLKDRGYDGGISIEPHLASVFHSSEDEGLGEEESIKIYSKKRKKY